ncbi:MAG TPA: anti-sigma factor [Devosiaceae bacterium]|jgi:anti-sigma-K factor RskA
MSNPEEHGDGFDGDQLLIAEYVLGLLDAAEHDRVAQRLANEPALAAELRLWQTRLSSLDTQFAEVSAPGAVLARIEARLFGGAHPSSASANGWWNSLSVWRTIAGVAAAVAVIAIGANLLRPAPLDPTEFATRMVAALADQGTGVSFVALYDQRSGTVRLTALSGNAVPDRDYELWAIEGSNAPRSMGVVPVDAGKDVKLTPEILASFGAGTVLAVTLEPKGGSPTGNPTGPIVAKGAATAI